MLVATCSKRRVISTISAWNADAAAFLRGILPVSSPSHSLRRGPSNILPSSSVFGSAVRLHRNQLFYCADFAVDEDDVRNFDDSRAAARTDRAEVAGAKTKGRPEKIRAKFLKAQSVA